MGYGDEIIATAEAKEAKREQQKASQSSDGVSFPAGLSH